MFCSSSNLKFLTVSMHPAYAANDSYKLLPKCTQRQRLLSLSGALFNYCLISKIHDYSLILLYWLYQKISFIVRYHIIINYYLCIPVRSVKCWSLAPDKFIVSISYSNLFIISHSLTYYFALTMKQYETNINVVSDIKSTFKINLTLRPSTGGYVGRRPYCGMIPTHLSDVSCYSNKE